MKIRGEEILPDVKSIHELIESVRRSIAMRHANAERARRKFVTDRIAEAWTTYKKARESTYRDVPLGERDAFEYGVRVALEAYHQRFGQFARAYVGLLELAEGATDHLSETSTTRESLRAYAIELEELCK